MHPDRFVAGKLIDLRARHAEHGALQRPVHQDTVVSWGTAPMEAAMTIKSRTLRLPADQAEALEAIAGVDEVSVNEEIQRAIAAHIEARRSDPDFRRRLQASIERNREILERLAR
jgi:hypothetical protein